MRHIIFDIFDWIDTVMIVKIKIVKIFDTSPLKKKLKGEKLGEMCDLMNGRFNEWTIRSVDRHECILRG